MAVQVRMYFVSKPELLLLFLLNIRWTKKSKLIKVFYKSIKGKREKKYGFLGKNNIFTINFEKLEYKYPHYFFTKKIFQIKIFMTMGFL